MPKIIRFHETGSADVLKIEDLPLTEPGDGEFSGGRKSRRLTVLFGDDGYVLLSTIGRNNRCISY